VLLLFGPEIGLGFLGSKEAEGAFSVQEIDYFIGECGRPGKGETLGDYLERGVQEIGELRDRFGCPGILGHPLRWPILRHVGKTGQGFELPAHGPFPPLDSYEDPRQDVEELLDLDISALSLECIRCDVPVEINEGDWRRILVMNHRTFAERYLYFYHALAEEGVEFALGSDTHNVEHPAPTAFVVAEMLGIETRSMRMLARWLG
jgi:hypothetical protein